jgi:uncharacterized protein
MVPVIRLAAVILLACFANAAWSEETKPAADPARVEAARDLMAITGAAKQFDAVMPMLMQQFEPLFLKLAPGHEKEVKEVLAGLLTKFSERKSELFEKIAGLYSENMTTDEMKDLAKFFSTGTGARFIQLQPKLVQGSMAIGQQWGQQLGREIDKEMREELTKRGIKI